MATISAETRTETGKGIARQLRLNKRIPAVLYGGGEANTNLSLELRTLLIFLNHEKTNIKTHQYQLVIDGQEPCLVSLREMQTHPLTGTPRHIDFIRSNTPTA